RMFGLTVRFEISQGLDPPLAVFQNKTDWPVPRDYFSTRLHFSKRHFHRCGRGSGRCLVNAVENQSAGVLCASRVVPERPARAKSGAKKSICFRAVLPI